MRLCLFLFLSLLTLFSCEKEKLQRDLDTFSIDGSFTLQQLEEEFKDVRSIQNLRIDFSDISNLDFLKDIDEIGLLYILSCPNLTDISGLQTVELGALQIFDCNGIKGISGLTQLDTLSSFIIQGAASLEYIDLPNLQYVESLLGFQDLPMLKEIKLPALTAVGDRFYVARCTRWTDAQFGKLATIESELTINNNASIANLDFFSKLESTSRINIFENTQLANIDGLSQLGPLKEVSIRDNEQLEDVCILKTAIQSSTNLRMDIFLGLHRLGMEYFDACP